MGESGLDSKSNILLIGLPGCGKSTVGALAAERLGWTFADMDETVESMTGRTVKELFAQGEECFRDAETEACRLLAQRRHTVIAAGGGVVKRRQNIDLLHQSCLIVFLDRSAKEIAGDVDTASRPLLSGGAGQVFVLERERRPLYLAAADRVLAGNLSPMEAAQQICRWGREYNTAREER